jgi:hypothetical protein
MTNMRSLLRTFVVPGLAKFLAVVAFALGYVGLIGPIARVLEHGWYEGLFSGASVVFLLLLVAGIFILKWVYPFLPPSSKADGR